jgi:hypothetical protein
MSTRVQMRMTAVMGLVITAVLAAPMAALAADGPSADVAAALKGQLLRDVQGSAARLYAQAQGDETMKGAPDFSGSVQADDVHEIFRFSDAFYAGKDVGPAVVRTDQWVAGVRRGAKALGTITVHAAAGAVDLVGFDGNIPLATALAGVAEDETLVADESGGAWFAIDGDTVRPVNAQALIELPQPAPLSDLRRVVAARVAQAIADADGMSDAVGGGGPVASVPADEGFWGVGTLLAGFLVLAVGAAVLVPGAGHRRRLDRI